MLIRKSEWRYSYSGLLWQPQLVGCQSSKTANIILYQQHLISIFRSVATLVYYQNIAIDLNFMSVHGHMILMVFSF